MPILKLLLACDGISRRCELLRMDEAIDPIFFDEFRATTTAMLVMKAHKTGGA